MATRGQAYEYEKTGGGRAGAFLRMVLAVIVWVIVAAVVFVLIGGLIDLIWGPQISAVFQQLLGT
jgi:hypothetical protein